MGKRVAVLAFDGISPFHLSVPGLIFGEVGNLTADQSWECTLWSQRAGAVVTSDGYTLGPVQGPEAVDGADIVVVPSWVDPEQGVDDRIVDTIRSAHDQGAMVVGLCLGAFVVAATGLLDGRAATTHWRAAPMLAAAYPAVEVDPAILYIDHGDVMTSAGTAASIDACLQITRQRLGSAAANQIARSLVVAPHRSGGQSQYIERAVPTLTQNDPIQKVTDWILNNLDAPLEIDKLAQVAQMSRRAFTRQFRVATGSSPARWVTNCRLDSARNMLETSKASVEAVAVANGFSGAITFRQNFVSAYGLTPTAYRRAFTGSR